ncbi:MAG TPA: glycosyltransferase [Desulfuromonadales bacterium]|nr:glycosyltransferase [Desulfuromonadales bacterium]
MIENNLNKISVLHLIHTMAYGGIETAVLNWLKCINKTRFNIVLVCFANSGGSEAPFVSAAQSLGFTVEKISWGKRKPVLKAAKSLASIAKKHSIDIIHTHNCYADVVGLVTRWIIPLKIITTVYVWADLGWKRNLIQFINKIVVRRFDCVSAHCQETYEQSKTFIDSKKLKLLICGFEGAAFVITEESRKAARISENLSPGTPVLINIARLYPEKAHDMLLECFREIVLEIPEARLLIYGVGPLETELKELCSKLEMNDYVVFKGFAADLGHVFSVADVQVHPSYMEGVPLALCSGMAAGLPIVASDVGGIKEVIIDGKTGKLITPNDRKAFIRETVRLVRDASLRRELGDAAKRFINEDYSLIKAVSAVEKTYEEMMS